MKLGLQAHFGDKSQSEGTIQLVGPNAKNEDIYSTALTREMGRSARGKLVQ